MANYGDKQRMYEKALRTKEKWERIIEENALYPCKQCGEQKPADQFVIQYISNQQVGKYRYLYECKACKRKRTYKKREKRRETIDGALSVIIKHLYQGAKKRGLEFSIDQDDLKSLREIQNGQCYYTGYQMEFSFVGFKRGTLHERTKYQVSCDRLDNDRGYVQGNIVLCCSFVNNMKGTLTEQEFYTICEDILENHK